MVLGLDNPRLGGWEQPNRNSKAHELVGEFLSLSRMKVDAGSNVLAHDHDKEGSHKMEKHCVGPTKVESSDTSRKGRKRLGADVSLFVFWDTNLGGTPRPHDKENAPSLGFFAFCGHCEEI